MLKLLVSLISLLVLVNAKSILEPKIVRGDQVNISKFAHSVFLVINSAAGSYVCGSSVINQKILLTAAHCIDSCVNKCLGSAAFAGNADKRRGDKIPILGTAPHKNFDRSRIQNDIGLVLLENPLQLGKFVKRVALTRVAPPQSTGTVAGWGLVNEIQSTHTDYLHSVQQTIWNHEHCRKMLPTLPNGTLCAGDVQNQRYASEGDSGSALIINQYIQIGIVSYKRPDISRAIVVYTDVAYFYKWIQYNSKKLYFVTPSQIEPKIVSGYKTKIKSHPYSAALIIVQESSAYMCGASIVNQKVLLTAAHCFDDALNQKVKSRAHIGHVNKRIGHVIRISKLMIHPKYDTVAISCDIALAGLKKEIKFGRAINRVALAQRRHRAGPALIAGWGLLEEDPHRDTEFLHETGQRVWPKRDCVKLLIEIPNGTFCGGEGPAGGYPSRGDSGSPLIIDGYMQIGLVSFKEMNISTSVIIYTDITYYYKWITKNAKAVFCG
ncbi:serine protease 55-like [Vanessa tameamea]|uniref:Serine protease 55-like n=1 Tax=Vanessa tameamea TaxID=334116 RepID=A0ABM4AZD5_VANTA